jgi:NAD+ synthase
LQVKDVGVQGQLLRCQTRVLRQGRETLDGDGGVDIMPLLSLYKTQVRLLGRYLEVPKRILEKAPSPDLIQGITDEDALGLSYDELDEVLFSLEQGFTTEQVTSKYGIPLKQVCYVKQLISNSEHLRCMPETIEEKVP